MANKTKKSSKSKFKFSKISIAVFLILSVVLTVFAFVFKTQIENLINYNSTTAVIDYNGLVMHTINVGQAKAIIIKLPDGKSMLVDSGNTGEKKNEKLKSYLINNYFNSVQENADGEYIIDYFVITHSDTDHIGGATMIFDNFQVNKVFRPSLYSSKAQIEPDQSIVNNINEENERAKQNGGKEIGEVNSIVTTQAWGNVITKMYAEPNCEVVFSKAGIEIVESTYSIKFCAPTEKYYSNVNGYSPIIILEYASRKIMLTGDVTVESERKVLSNLEKCDILKVAHHGSLTSTSEEFLQVVKPSYAIISVNSEERKNYNLPKQEILNRLSKYMPESNIYRTDKNGNIVCSISSDAKISFVLDVQNNSYYIKVEYVLAGCVLVLFVVCFSVGKKNIKTQKN